MKKPNLTQRLTLGLIAASMCVTPSVAAATARGSVASQYVALSYLASDTSRAAMCGTAASTAAAQAAVAGATAAAGQTVPSGCVLPATDPVAAISAEAAAPLPGQSFSLLGPLIAGLAGLVAVLVIANITDQDDDNVEPVSPS